MHDGKRQLLSAVKMRRQKGKRRKMQSGLPRKRSRQQGTGETSRTMPTKVTPITARRKILMDQNQKMSQSARMLKWKMGKSSQNRGGDGSADGLRDDADKTRTCEVGKKSHGPRNGGTTRC
jgi:hypothetical protein